MQPTHCTSDAAHLEKELGTIETGKLAGSPSCCRAILLTEPVRSILTTTVVKNDDWRQMGLVRQSFLIVASAAVFIIRGPVLQAQILPTRVAAVSAPDLRAWDAAVDRMLDTGELRLRASADDTLIAGRVHDRFDQFYRASASSAATSSVRPSEG